MDEISGRPAGVVYSATSDYFDLVGPCYRVTLSWRPTIQLTGDLCLVYLWVSDFKHRLQKMLLVEKIWLVEK